MLLYFCRNGPPETGKWEENVGYLSGKKRGQLRRLFFADYAEQYAYGIYSRDEAISRFKDDVVSGHIY